MSEEEFKHDNCPDCGTEEEIEEESEEEIQARYSAASIIVANEMEKIEEAFNELCDRAAELSEEHGIPVYFAGEKYVPVSMAELFGDGEEVWDMFEDDITDYRYDGRLEPGDWWAPSTC